MKLATPNQIQVGDKIRFSEEFLIWYAQVVGQSAIDEGCYDEFREVKSVRICDNCPEEYYNFFFSSCPGDFYHFPKESEVEFPLEVM